MLCVFGVARLRLWTSVAASLILGGVELASVDRTTYLCSGLNKDGGHNNGSQHGFIEGTIGVCCTDALVSWTVYSTKVGWSCVLYRSVLTCGV